MVDRTEVFSVADEILDEGVQPTVRSVRERLALGGSFSDIGPHFADWAAIRGFRLRPSRNDLPGHLLNNLAAAAAEIWRDGLRAGGIAAHNEMDRLTRERDAWRAIAQEATAHADEIEARRDEVEQQRTANDAGEPIGRRARSMAFWAEVMLEIVRLLGDGRLDVKTIRQRLCDETIRRAPELHQRGGLGLLAYKMRYHAERGRYFSELEKNVFCCRAEQDARTERANAA